MIINNARIMTFSIKIIERTPIIVIAIEIRESNSELAPCEFFKET